MVWGGEDVEAVCGWRGIEDSVIGELLCAQAYVLRHTALMESGGKGEGRCVHGFSYGSLHCLISRLIVSYGEGRCVHALR